MAIRGLANRAIGVGGGVSLTSIAAQDSLSFDQYIQAGSLIVVAIGLLVRIFEAWMKYKANKKTR